MGAPDIRVEMRELKTKGKEVTAQGEDYIKKVQKIYSKIEELRTGWEGEDNANYIAKVNEHKETIRRLGEVIKNYGTFMDATAKTYENLQNDVKAAADKL